MDVDVLLCDSAKVREGLLHLLGGGITQLWREQYPAQMVMDLALVFTLTPAERERRHVLNVNILGADGEQIAQAQGDFQVAAIGEDVDAWASSIVPLVLPLQNVAIPEAGDYMIDVLVDNQSVRTFNFKAMLGPRPE